MWLNRTMWAGLLCHQHHSSGRHVLSDGIARHHMRRGDLHPPSTKSCAIVRGDCDPVFLRFAGGEVDDHVAKFTVSLKVSGNGALDCCPLTASHPRASDLGMLVCTQIVAVTLLLFSRQTVVVIYAIFILLASIDAFNAARQGVKLRIYVVSLAIQSPGKASVLNSRNSVCVGGLFSCATRNSPACQRVLRTLP